jgi:hypothetical protein
MNFHLVVQKSDLDVSQHKPAGASYGVTHRLAEQVCGHADCLTSIVVRKTSGAVK